MDEISQVEQLLAEIQTFDPAERGSRTRQYALFRRLCRILAPNGQFEPWVFEGDLLERIRSALDREGRAATELDIVFLESCLKQGIRAGDPIGLGKSHQMLGEAYHQRFLLTEDTSTDLAKAQEHYDAALKQYMIANDAADSIRVHCQLGEVHRMRGERDAALQEFRTALAGYSTEAPSKECLRLHSDIAATLLEGDEPESPEAAIGHLQTALNHTDESLMPEFWAELQWRLGIAHQYRMNGDELLNLQNAAHYYQEAFRVLTKIGDAEGAAYSQYNLGNVMLERTSLGEGDFTDQALELFRSAQRVYTESEHPSDWADLQRDIGLALTKGRNDQNVEQRKCASAYFQSAIRIFEALGRDDSAESTKQLLAGNEEIICLINELNKLREREQWATHKLKEIRDEGIDNRPE